MLHKLYNRSEQVTYKQIAAVADRYGLEVNGKTRVKDVIDVDKLDCPPDLYSYALKSHFDFLILREHEPIYAVEFDGPTHNSAVQKERDRKKDLLCRMSGLPILRINSNHLSTEYGRYSLLAWIIEVYELQTGFYEAQESGQIPWDEPFDPFSLFGTNLSSNDRFPLWMSAQHRLKFRRLHTEGKIHDWTTTGYVGRSKNWDILGYEIAKVTENEGLWVQSGIRYQQFPIMFSDLLDEILTIQLSWKIDDFLEGRVRPEPLPEIEARAAAFETRYEMLHAHWTTKPE